MIGSAYCFYKDKHLALDLFTRKATGTAKIVMDIIIEICIVFFVCYVFIFGGFKLAMNATNMSSVMHIPFKILYAIFPVSGIFIIVARILKYLQIFINRKGGKK